MWKVNAKKILEKTKIGMKGLYHPALFFLAGLFFHSWYSSDKPFFFVSGIGYIILFTSGRIGEWRRRQRGDNKE